MWLRLKKANLGSRRRFKPAEHQHVRSEHQRWLRLRILSAPSHLLPRFTWRSILFDAKPCDIQCRKKDEREQRRNGQSTHDRIC
jgi:hypothetical protein